MAITAFRHASSMIPQCRGRSFPGRAKGDDHAHSVDCGVRRYACNASGRLGAVAALRGKRATPASPRYSVVMAALRAFFATQTVRKEIQPPPRSSHRRTALALRHQRSRASGRCRTSSCEELQLPPTPLMCSNALTSSWPSMNSARWNCWLTASTSASSRTSWQGSRRPNVSQAEGSYGLFFKAN
jgi:hypothetical protein